ncbi:hemagglutinin, partial [Ralstonia sp. SM1884_UCD616_TZ26]
SRDTSNTNTVLDKNPDLGEILSRQAELQKAASAAGEAVARTIGDIANSKRDDALAEAEKAHQAGNEELANKYRAEADQWKEGGEYRAGLHMAGGALVAGLGGGSAIGGAIGAGATSLAAPQLTELADKVASSMGGGVAGQMAGNVVANVAAGAVGSVGGGSGAFMGSNVDRYNRQLHEKETSVIRNKARQLAAAGGISYDDALERLSSQALRDVDAEYAAAHPGVDMQAQAWLNQLKAENPEGFNHMPLFQATRAEYNDSTLYAGTKLTSPDIYAAANRPTIPGTISPNRVNLMPLVTGNAKSLANTAIEALNKGMAIVSGPLGPDVSMPLIPMTEEERAAAGATAVMAAPFGVRGSTAAADANTAAATGRAADAANAARAGETPTWTANGGAYSQSSAGAGTPVTTVRVGPGYSAADVVPGRAVGETANAGAKGVGAFADEAKLIGHFEKHGAEFGTKSASEYLQVGQDIMQYGQKVEYLYKGETRTGFVQFMGNRANGQSKFGFVGTNADGAITTIHTESGNSFWKMLNNGNIDKVIKPVP